MANFTKHRGSAGIWSEEECSLLIHIGEVAEIILWGGGPPGKERLCVCCIPSDIVSDLGPGGKVTGTAFGPNERLVKLAPLKVGTLHIHARVGDSFGPDYSKPAKVIILPRKPSSLGPEHVIMYSDHEGNSDIEEAYTKSRRSVPNATVYGAQSVQDFVNLLAKYRDGGRHMSALEFNTHGGPGIVQLGNEVLKVADLRKIAGRGYHTAFAAGAKVFFHGCNVAEGTMGNEFLITFGEVLLRGGGGSVGASTSRGFSHPLGGYFGNGKVYHLWGNTKRVIVNPGGFISDKINFDD